MTAVHRTLLSVGYEGRSAAELVDTLVAAGAEVLVDVRLRASSRKPGLAKRALSAALEDAGIAYVHLPGLGNPRENREAFRTGDVDAGVRRFRTLLDAPGPRAALAELEAMTRDRRVALLCFERDHHRCHRQVVAEAVPGVRLVEL